MIIKIVVMSDEGVSQAEQVFNPCQTGEMSMTLHPPVESGLHSLTKIEVKATTVLKSLKNSVQEAARRGFES